VAGVLRIYKPGSIIYFAGDKADSVFILKSGAVSLAYHSIETNEEVRETIKSGEFFSVKSALARRPREETALVIKPSQVLVLNSDEFENLISKNIKLINNFLRVFSNQLRRIGKQVHGLINHSEVSDTQGELFNIGEYYLKNHKYQQAQYVYKTYLKHYKNGSYAPQAEERLKIAVDALEGKGLGTFTPLKKSETVKPKAEKESVDIATKYYDAVSLFSQEKYEDAYRLFKALFNSESLDENAKEYLSKIEFDMGRCLIALKRYKDAILTFTDMIRKYPKDENVKNALFNIGISYKKQGNPEKAASFFNKVLKMLPESPVDRKAKRELASLKTG